MELAIEVTASALELGAVAKVELAEPVGEKLSLVVQAPEMNCRLARTLFCAI